MVHGIDVAEVGDGEEEAGGLLTDWLVLLAGSVDVLLGDGGDLLLLLDLGGLLLGGGEDVDRLLVLQDVLVGRQHLQDLLLDLEQLLLVGRALEDQALLLLFEVWPFLLDDNAQQLVVESLIGDHEVDDRHFRRYFGQVVRIPVLGCQVEGKLAGVFDDLVSELYVNACALLVGLLQEDRVESWIQLFSNVFKQDWLSELDGVF